jgi:hypothetical protein
MRSSSEPRTQRSGVSGLALPAAYSAALRARLGPHREASHPNEDLQMEVAFRLTRQHWVLVNTRTYKEWLYSRRPLTGCEFWLSWFFLLLSSVGGVGLLVFIVVAIWYSLAWYFVVGSAALVVFCCGMAREVLRPHRPVRGLFIELTFRMHLEAELIEKYKARLELQTRRQEEQGQLNLGHRCLLRIDSDGYTLITEYPPTAAGAAQLENRYEWSAMTAIERDSSTLCFTSRTAGTLMVPCGAFADEEACQRFAETAEAYRAASAPPGPLRLTGFNR